MTGPRSARRYRDNGASRSSVQFAGLRRIVAIATIALSTMLAQNARAASPTASDELVQTLVNLAPGLKPDVLRLALTAEANAAREGLVTREDLLTVIDYSIPSTQPRLFVFDLAARKLLFRELVAHGKNSGEATTTFFSNDDKSLATSLGLFVTAGTYTGHNGYSLRLRGLDEGFNDHAWQRAIVLHGAAYVSDAAVRSLGRLGRSWGCPAVRAAIAQKLIDTVKGGTAIFAYYPDSKWLQASHFLHESGGGSLTALSAK